MSGRKRGGAARPEVQGLEGRALPSGPGTLTLTPAGTAAGFALGTFATGFPVSNATGPMGMAVLPNGAVAVADSGGQVDVFAKDADGQAAAGAAVGARFSGGAAGLATLGGKLYLAVPAYGGGAGAGEVVQLNADGTLDHVVAAGLTAPTGLVADDATGTLFVTALDTGAILEIHPATGAVTTFASGLARPDGLALTPGGKTLYVAEEGTPDGGDVVGLDVATGAQVFQAGPVATLDGIALGAGSLAGRLFVNTNDGRVVELDLATKSQTVIASNGSRGDFVAVDPTDGALLLTQTDRVLRLAAPAGGGFATDPSLTAIGPDTAVAGSGPLTLTVDGGGFQAGSVVTWDGVALPTQFVGASQLVATVPAADLAAAGRASVAVANPDGTTAGPLAFTVTAASSSNPKVPPANLPPAGTTPAASNPGSSTTVSPGAPDLLVGPTDGPRLLTIERFGYHARPRTLVLNFAGPLSPATATDLANYTIARVGPRGRLVGPRPFVPIAAASYTPGSSSVTLSPAHRLNVHWRYVLTLDGTSSHALAGPTGLRLDGLSTGHPGSDATAFLTRANLVGFDPPSHRHGPRAR